MAEDLSPRATAASTNGPSSRVVLYGSRSCEDTALVRNRLASLGIPFDEVDIDADRAAAERVSALNGGQRITPTLVAGGPAIAVAGGGPAIAEPSIRDLERWLAATGHDLAPPAATRFFGRVAEHAITTRTLPRVGGDGPLGTDSIARWRGRRQVVVFFGHDAACLACWGYAKQLARLRRSFEEVETEPVIVVADRPARAAEWIHELGGELFVLADQTGAWKRAVAEGVGADPTAVLLVVLDRFGAPRVGSSAAEAGGLIDPGEAVEWGRWLTLECPECAGELAWPE